MSIATPTKSTVSDLVIQDKAANIFGQRFDFLSLIGSSGLANLYLVRDRCKLADPPSEPVSLVLRTLAAGQDAAAPHVDLFLAQSRAASNLEHGNITPVVESEFLNGVPYSLFRFPSKFETLRSMTARSGWLNVEDTVAYGTILQVSDALSYAHSLGVLHLSMRPDDILIDESGKAFLTGFGLKRDDLHGPLLTELAAQIERQYASPELAGGHVPGEQGDLYSLGAILYEMITDRLPMAPGAESRHKRKRTVLPPDLIIDTISPEVSRLVMTLLEDDPAARFENVLAFQTAFIRAIGAGSGIARAEPQLDLMECLEESAGTPESGTASTVDEAQNGEAARHEVTSYASEMHHALQQAIDPGEAASEAPPAISPASIDARLPEATQTDEVVPILLGCDSEPLMLGLEPDKPALTPGRTDANSEAVNRDEIPIRPTGRLAPPAARASLAFKQIDGSSRGGRGLLLAAGLAVLLTAVILIATQRPVSESKNGHRPENNQVSAVDNATRAAAQLPGLPRDSKNTGSAPPSRAAGRSKPANQSLSGVPAANPKPRFRKSQRRRRRLTFNPYLQLRPRRYGRLPDYYE